MVLWAKGVGRRAALAMENLGSWLLSSPSKFNCKQECVVKGIGGIRLLAWLEKAVNLLCSRFNGVRASKRHHYGRLTLR